MRILERQETTTAFGVLIHLRYLEYSGRVVERAHVFNPSYRCLILLLIYQIVWLNIAISLSLERLSVGNWLSRFNRL